MGFLFNLLFGSNEASNSKKSKANDLYRRDCLEEDFYEDLYCDAKSGDQEAITEMKEEFGDDWEDEL